MEHVATNDAARIEAQPWRAILRQASSRLVQRCPDELTPSNDPQGCSSDELHSESELSWQAMFRSASDLKPTSSSLLSSSVSDQNRGVPPLKTSVSENPERQSNNVSGESTVPSARIESSRRSYSDLPWQANGQSASFGNPNASLQNRLPGRSISFKHPISSCENYSPLPSTSSAHRQVRSEGGPLPKSSDLSSNLPWKDMFRSASFRNPSTSCQNNAYFPPVQREDLHSVDHAHESQYDSSTLPWQLMLRSYSFCDSSPRHQSNTSLSESCMISPHEPVEPNSSSLSGDPLVRLSFYMAMAHAGLALVVFFIYHICNLLEEYLPPIQWAVLCSIPLRRIQQTLVRFWSEPLQLGFTETILAVPLTILKAIIGTLVNIRDVCFSVVLHQTGPKISSQNKSAFTKLVQMLLSLGVLVIAYEQTGKAGSVVLLCLSFTCTSFLESTVSVVSSCRSRNISGSTSSIFLREVILKRLKIIVAIVLISGVIMGLLAVVIFFSCRIAFEGKDALIMLKTHVEESKYAERVGIKKWMDDNDVFQIIDWYASHFYDTVSQHINNWLESHNLAEFFNSTKYFLMAPSASSSAHHQAVSFPSPSEKLESVRTQVVNGDWRKACEELVIIFWELVISREDLFEKAKEFSVQKMDVSQHTLLSYLFFLMGCAKLVFGIGYSVILAAWGLLNFGSQVIIFFCVLYYLVTSESGELTEQVISKLPISRAARVRYVEILNNAISGVLLATAKVALFQGCLTWLLFKLYSIHFLYMSTLLALISPLLPIFPTWLSTIPAALQLVLERRYLLAVSLAVIHLVLMDYGASEIEEEIPGYSTYLTGISIIGGMALFSSAIEVTHPITSSKYFPRKFSSHQMLENLVIRFSRLV